MTRRIRSKPEFAVPRAVEDLLSKFEYPDQRPEGGPISVGGGGGAPTIVVAASDASDLSKSKADLIAPGTNDHDVIQAAVDRIQAAVTGGRLLLTEGTFVISTDQINLDEDVWLQGLGFRTVIETTDNSGVMVTTGNECQISDLALLGPSGSDTTIGIQGSATSNNRILRVYFNRMNTAINDPGDRSLISECWSVSTIEFLTADGQSEIQIIGNTQAQSITITSSGTVTGIQITDNILEGQISISDVAGFVIAENVWSEVNGGNDDIITLDTVTAGIINGNTTPDGGGYDIMDITNSSDIIIMANIWDNVVGGIVTSGSSEILNDKNIINGTVEDSTVSASSNLAQFSQAGSLSTGTGSFKLPFTLDATIVSVQIAVGTSPTGADLIVDVNQNGTTIFSTQANRPTVPDSDADGVGAETTPDVTAISEGDYLTVDIDQVGSSEPGQDLTVSIEWRPA